MSEQYDNLRRGRDLENRNQRRFEQEVAEEIGISRRNENERGEKRTGQTETTRTPDTERKFGTETERFGGSTTKGHERPRC